MGLIWIRKTTIVKVDCEDFEPLSKMAWKPTREIGALLFDVNNGIG
jgi:hypothetical protein